MSFADQVSDGVALAARLLGETITYRQYLSGSSYNNGQETKGLYIETDIGVVVDWVEPGDELLKTGRAEVGDMKLLVKGNVITTGGARLSPRVGDYVLQNNQWWKIRQLLPIQLNGKSGATEMVCKATPNPNPSGYGSNQGESGDYQGESGGYQG